MTLSVKIRHRQGDFSLDVTFAAEGGVTALFGASGSGKTSILRILGGLTRPHDGKIELDGDMLLDTERRLFIPAHRRRFGYVFQEPRLFPHLSVRQNLTYGRWFARRAGPSADLDRILEMLGISHLLERRPATLSGGEKQRVSIGRALLSSPRLLLMDEPLSALDEARKAEILPYLERLRDELDLPILYVSHSVPEVARLADRVVVLADGRVQAVGSASDMLGNLSDAGGREAGSVLTGTVSALDAETGLATIAFRSMSLVVPPAHLSVGQRVRVHVPARDVLVATEKPAGISALNIVPGQISTLTRMAGGTVDLAIVCGDETLHARITEVSVGRLQLAVGRPVHAIIKTVALERS
ncbi:molybdenum ABC transporter ATP-binding protein [Affinirhizobium pseudoryzae]|uniref:molybdenum ABC transporter ATP-binding protein n=1 Tax=Allorhizobium pseudoryzae TaxID=379684 RepID=UPI0013E9F94E|nr:molybdenum ABC transporter ATP-binding protein [Allorhizobium pseudoryzae]